MYKILTFTAISDPDPQKDGIINYFGKCLACPTRNKTNDPVQERIYIVDTKRYGINISANILDRHAFIIFEQWKPKL
jgi:hypothetical protein